MIKFLIGMMVGALLGIGFHCMLIISKDADEKYS